jgi:hypothetical protein
MKFFDKIIYKVFCDLTKIEIISASNPKKDAKAIELWKKKRILFLPCFHDDMGV